MSLELEGDKRGDAPLDRRGKELDEIEDVLDSSSFESPVAMVVGFDMIVVVGGGDMGEEPTGSEVPAEEAIEIGAGDCSILEAMMLSNFRIHCIILVCSSTISPSASKREGEALAGEGGGVGVKIVFPAGGSASNEAMPE